MRNIQIVPGEYYHVYNRGNNKQPIFLDKSDLARFLFLILYFQSPLTFDNLGRQTSYFARNRAFNINGADINIIIKKRFVELTNFALMPNHFHLTIHELRKNGIAQYMQRVLCAYTKYFNIKYQKSGHLFQGPYKIVHIENNEQLLHLSAYIHRNPKEIKLWKNREHQYPWSSYQDYIKTNRWREILKTNIISDQFIHNKDYLDFVKKSGTKEFIEKDILTD